MSDRLPYEEKLAGKWDDLPLPDENIAWDDMRRRLDEDDDKPIIPFWLRGCAGWALLGILVLGLAWWILKPLQWFNKEKQSSSLNVKTTVPAKQQEKSRQQLKDSNTNNSKTDQPTTAQKPGISTTDTGTVTSLPPATANVNATQSPAVNTTRHDTEKNLPRTLRKEKDKVHSPATLNQGDKTQISIQQQNASRKKRSTKKAIKPGQTANDPAVITADTVLLTTTNPSLITNNPVPGATTDTGAGTKTVNASKLPDANTIGKPAQKDTANTKEKQTTRDKSQNTKKDSTQNQKLEWSAGVGLQQQIPVAGQKWNPYNAQGRKGSLADYIPSVYARITKPGKWFLQGEFRYGAPQYVKEQLFRQTRQNDTSAAQRFYIQNSSTVKKTFYHQLPLVFNYYIRPGWSVGAGVQWNRFYSAISENEVLYHDNILDTNRVLSKVIAPVKRDTTAEFRKSFFQGVVETQYKWKRFSFGARYSFGLQPYIRFSLPGTSQQQASINSFQLFIRYELWRQKRK